MKLSSIAKKTTWLAVALAAIVLLSLAGCAGNTTPTPAATIATTTTNTTTAPVVSTPKPTITQSAAPAPAATTPATQDITSQALSSLGKLTSYQYDVSMSLKTAGTVKNQPLNYTMTGSGNGSNDVTNQKMQMNLNMDIESPGQGKMSIPMAYYMVDGWQYVQVSVPIAGTQWMKTNMDMTSFDAKDQTQQVLEMLKSAVKVNVMGTEDVDGVSCYILQVTPDLTVLSEWLKSFQGTTDVTGSEPTNIDISKFVKNLSIKVDVTRDTYLVKKSDVSASIAMSGTDLGSAAQATDNLSMDLLQTVKMTQTNQPVTITLPPEAQTAKDVTPQK